MGAMSCQHCGMPLVSSTGGAIGAGQSEQQELPAWLESLRAHERPVPGGQENRQPFSMDELVDEDSMPSWMRQDRLKVAESGNSDSLPAMPGGVGPEKQNGPSSGFQAGSLIDERSLPAWMRENQSQGSSQPVAGQNVSANSLVDQQGLPAWIKDLSQAAPPQTPTMNNQYGQATQAPAMNNQYGQAAPPQTPPIMNQYGLPVQTPVTPPTMPGALHVPLTPATNEPPAHGFSAHDLLDMQAMPGWMSGAQGPGQGPGSPPSTQPIPMGQGFSAGELVDQGSVPAWMKNLQGQEKSDPQSAMGVPVNGRGQMTGMGQGMQGTMSGEGMPAGSLLDKNSMPSWMQENQLGSMQGPPPAGQSMAGGSLLDKNSMPSWMQESQLGSMQGPQPGGQGMSAGSLLDMNSAPTWMREGDQSSTQAPQPGGQSMAAGSLIDMNSMPAWMREGTQSGTPGSQAGGQGMAAGSLIDMNSMPAWMRNADNGQPGAGANARPASPQPRPVPSRPRNEMVPQEQSEAAANVFSSMLGVAASAPALPGQGQMPVNNLGVPQGQPMPPFPGAQPSLPGWQQAPVNQYNQGAQPQMWQMSGSMPALNSAPVPNPYAQGGQTGSMGNMQQPRMNNPQQPAWTGFSAVDRTALGVTTGAEAGNYQPNPGNAQSTDTKKKSFFDSIRDFFNK